MTERRATVLGYPRIGRDRELKRAVEAHWAGRLGAAELLERATTLRQANLRALAAAGLDEVPVNDFSLYDSLADLVQLFGVVPRRHRAEPGAGGGREQARLAEYFAMARGTDRAAPLEMTKWFDTNYHCLVPEIGPESAFELTADGSDTPVERVREAASLGITARPVLIGPLTFLALAKPEPGAPASFDPLSLLPRLLPLYTHVLDQLAAAGTGWVQLDEPVLAAAPSAELLAATEYALDHLAAAERRPKLLVATYFDTVARALAVLRDSRVDGVALDFTGRARSNLGLLAGAGGLPGKRLLAGVVDGRNVWINDLADSERLLDSLDELAGEVVVSTSCSLLHVPLDANRETELDPQVRAWLAFAEQKLDEVTALAHMDTGDAGRRQRILAANSAALAARQASALVRNPAVRERAAAVEAADLHRPHRAAERIGAQRARLALPLLPTTTIGSFPQTGELRAARAALSTGRLSATHYDKRIAAEIEHVVRFQEELGFDVLVHGEPERADMVQYFAEQLDGFLVTRHGWVQSYGTRCVRPPILVGDVARPRPMTVRWSAYAQSLTDRPVKGMLTGPVTMLAWSFVRDDLPLDQTARQVALALRDEVADLEAEGIAIIQVDEPALRELLPAGTEDRREYLRWAVEAFRLSTSGIRDETQVHTHMCYAEFDDIIDAIADLDVDVISLEAARSRMEIAAQLTRPGHDYAVGPGVYDIHAPRVPSTEEMTERLRDALTHLPAERLWVNPDCGLKTRSEEQVRAALANMVRAAAEVRAALVPTP